VSEFDPKAFLTAFDYLKPEEAESHEALQSAIAAAQEAYGLPVTGDLDEMTVRVIGRTPRCGMPDTPQHVIGKPHWGLETVTWHLTHYPTGVGLTNAIVDQAIGQAFANWSAVCGLSFRQVKTVNEANIVMGVGRGRRADFDGPSGTLAWMQLPNRDDYRGQVQGLFDADENWVISGRGILLVNVACHEIGHALGLMHSRRGDQLMSPTYSSQVSKPLAEDAQRAVELYGPPKQAPTPPITPAPGDHKVRVLIQLDDDPSQQYIGDLAKRPSRVEALEIT
jgi:hypothetical protein